jgi:AbrB family looped-hinge helix DNA binding protein
MKVGERGQVTIPKRLRDRYGIRGDTDVDFLDDGNGIRIVKRSEGTKRVSMIRGTAKNGHWGSVDEYIEDIRGR